MRIRIVGMLFMTFGVCHNAFGDDNIKSKFNPVSTAVTSQTIGADARAGEHKGEAVGKLPDGRANPVLHRFHAAFHGGERLCGLLPGVGSGHRADGPARDGPLPHGAAHL